MHARASAWAFLILAAVTALPSTASAQRYQPPAGPTITPYLDYYRLPTGPLMDNYHDYVRPRSELQSRFDRVGTAIGQQRNRLGELQEDLQQVNPSGAASTGTHSTFQNLSHYYSGVRQSARSPQRSASLGNVGIAVGRGVGRGVKAVGGGAVRGR